MFTRKGKVETYNFTTAIESRDERTVGVKRGTSEK